MNRAAVAVALLAVLVFSGFGAVIGTAAAASAGAASSSQPPPPEYLGGTAAGETAIWWSWGWGGTANNTLYLYAAFGCLGAPTAINAPPSYYWQLETIKLRMGSEYSARVTAWSGGIQSDKSACASASTNAPPGVDWSASATGSPTSALGADTNMHTADSTSKEVSIQATDLSAAQFEIWTYATASYADGWAWQSGVWSNVTSGSNFALIAPLLYATSVQSCMAWDPALGGYLTVLGPSFTHNQFFTYLLKAGVWQNESATITMPGNYAVDSSEPCNMAYDVHDSEMLLLATAFVGTSPMPEYTFTYAGGSSWSNVSATAGTFVGMFNNGPTSSSMLAYDSTDSELVYANGYGSGLSAQGVYSVGTWTFSGGVWTNRSALPGQPYPVADGGDLGASWDGGYVVIGGGNRTSLVCGADTGSPYVYFFINNSWSNISSGGTVPFARSGCEYEDWGMFGGAIGARSLLAYGGGFSESNSISVTGNLASYYVNATGSAPPEPTYTPPTAPVNVTVSNPSGGDCSVSSVSWSNPSPPTGTYLSGDTVYVFNGSGSLVGAYPTGSVVTSLWLPSLTVGGTFEVAVQAVLSYSLSSPVSGVLAFVSGCLAGSLASILSNIPLSLLLALVLVIIASTVVVYGVTRRRGRGGGRRVGGRT